MVCVCRERPPRGDSRPRKKAKKEKKEKKHPLFFGIERLRLKE
jgi:hypothetical protein